MTSEAQQELNDDTYLALGRFVVRFSAVLGALESSTLFLISPPTASLPRVTRTLVEAALADRTAAPIVSSFFSVFHKYWEGKLTAEDVKIAKCLRKELDALVKLRNRLMHDSWMFRIVGGDDSPQNLSRSRVRAHGTGVEYEDTVTSPADIDFMTADAERLASVVNGSVFHRRPGAIGPELHPRMRIVDGKVQHSP